MTKAQSNANNQGHTIHFVIGNRGRIGKSLFSTILCHLYCANKQKFILFDTDPNQKDVSAMYGGITDVTWEGCSEIMMNHSDEGAKVDRIYEEALKQDVIVNTPSDSHAQLLFWLQQNGLDRADFLQGENLHIWLWFLSNGDLTSLELFKQTVAQVPVFTTVLVKNRGIEHEWSQEKADFTELLQNQPTIDFKTMPRAEREATFKQSTAYDQYQGNKLSRNRLDKYLQTQSDAIIKVFSFKSNVKAA